MKSHMRFQFLPKPVTYNWFILNGLFQNACVYATPTDRCRQTVRTDGRAIAWL